MLFLSASQRYFDATASREFSDCNWSQLWHRKYIVLHLLKICFSFATGASWQPSQTHLAQRLHLMVSTSVELHSGYSQFDWIFMFLLLPFVLVFVRNISPSVLVSFKLIVGVSFKPKIISFNLEISWSLESISRSCSNNIFWSSECELINTSCSFFNSSYSAVLKSPTDLFLLRDEATRALFNKLIFSSLSLIRLRTFLSLASMFFLWEVMSFSFSVRAFS